jgi:hypothetical protein
MLVNANQASPAPTKAAAGGGMRRWFNPSWWLLCAFFAMRANAPDILINSVQRSGPSRYGILMQVGTVIHK